jgi:hypothetical protein
VSDGAEQRYGPKECGSCRLWKPILEDARGPIGPCRLLVRTGNFPGTAPRCERYLSRDQAVPAAPPPEPTRRRSRTVSPSVPAFSVRRAGVAVEPQTADEPARAEAPVRGFAPEPAAERMPEQPRREPAGYVVINEEREVLDMTREELAQVVREVLREESGTVKLATRWEGGSVVLKPGDPGTQPKEIPLDSLFHKVVMIRDRLRVLEQKINASEKLTDAEKVDMQQYVTRCYGSLTTFNLLFRDEREKFVGEKS